MPRKLAQLQIRPFLEADTSAVIALWHDCGLTRPWNDPLKDIQRKLAVQPELFLVGEIDGKVMASAMAGARRNAMSKRHI